MICPTELTPSTFKATCTPHFNERLRACIAHLQTKITESHPTDPTLIDAIHYVLNTQGKRLRPLMVYAVGLAWGAPLEALDAPALAVELIHSYSLVHDDLPAMDDDDYRRGQPSCHKVYGEAIAILVGDALQSLAFDVLTRDVMLSDLGYWRCRMVAELSQAIGLQGMVGGQAMDLKLTQETTPLANPQMQETTCTTETNKQDNKADETASIRQQALLQTHQKKTGCLFSASLLMGALAARIDDTKVLQALKHYGQQFGIIFQLLDDLNDLQPTQSLHKKSNQIGETTTSSLTSDRYASQADYTPQLQTCHVSQTNYSPRQINHVSSNVTTGSYRNSQITGSSYCNSHANNYAYQFGIQATHDRIKHDYQLMQAQIAEYPHLSDYLTAILPGKLCHDVVTSK